MNAIQVHSMTDEKDSVRSDPLDGSVFGEYLRLALIGTATASAIFWATRGSLQPLALALVLSCIASLGFLVSTRFAGIIRLSILSVLIAVVAVLASKEGNWFGPILFFSPAALLCSLSVLVCRDLIIATGVSNQVSYRSLGIGVVVVASALWLIAFPMVESLVKQTEEQPSTFVVEEPTALEMLKIRSAKLVVFAIFTYTGACLGSFLNVVAASAPRGRSTTIRSSACPKCETPIRRIDNLPIVSYLSLQGRCRSCETPIPSRYLVVELIGAGIFGSLFLYELVTGAANIPGFQHYFYTGIVWIILYTKWPVVGIYFFHALMFSFLLMFGLMEGNRDRCPPKFAAALLSVFAALAIIVPTIQPVAFDDQIRIAISKDLPVWAEGAITTLVGALTGWLLGTVALLCGLNPPWRIALVLLGITLGWQATITIAVLWLIATFVLSRLPATSRPGWLSPVMLLFVVASMHHPAWKFLAERLW